MTRSAKADALRRRIALYRSYLRDGVNATLAKQYLREIATAEAVLAKLVDNEHHSSGDKPRD